MPYKDPEVRKAKAKIRHRRLYLENREKRLKQIAEYKKNNPDKVRAWAKTRRARNPLKYKAVDILNGAVRYGKLARPKVCSKCGIKGPVEGHHPDYTKPLEVIWLCRCCHIEAHFGRPAST